MDQITEKTVDIEDILKNKMGSKAKWIPSPLVNWLKRIVHQDEVNRFLWESRHLTGTPWLEECVKYLDMTLEVEGKENLPTVLRWEALSVGTMTAGSAILSMIS